MGPRPLKPGTKIEFISRHLGLTNAELIEKAKASGLKLSAAHADATRWLLRKKYGYKIKATKTKTKTKALDKPKRKYTKRKKQKNGVSPAKAILHAELRKLIFKLGYDESAEIWAEFESMHDRWS